MRPAQRFLVDRMLIRFGRWIRAAGHDCALDDHRAGDRALLERACEEDRMLLTCDRKLAEFRNAPGRVVVLPSNDLSAQASALSAQLSIDWLHRPFSRCLLCNGAVEAADPVPGSARNALPADAAGPITRCSVCEKLYWQGSHTARMRARLERWATGDFTV